MDKTLIETLLAPIRGFLHCETPSAWLAKASEPEQLPVLLLDHLHCELKAAQSAAMLLRRYAVDKASGAALLAWLKPYEDYVYRGVGDGHFGAAKNDLARALQVPDDDPNKLEITQKMVRLIREELHHFEQVLSFLQRRDIGLEKLSAATYASRLFREVRTYEPEAAIDKLIIGAYIEARSCERFAALAPLLETQGEAELAAFYISLLRSEARHYQDYLSLAATLAAAHGLEDIDARVQFFGAREAELIEQVDSDFRFHSGVPAAA